MTQTLRVRRVRYEGEAASQSYEFTRRVTVITGPVGIGKSSMLNSIKYAFGGSWTVPRDIRSSVKAVVLDITIGDEHLSLRREIQGATGTVTVTVRGGGSQILPLEGDEHETTLSRFLMLRLGIPDVQLPESTANPGERLTTVTFNDVMNFIYLDQDQIDGVVGFDGDRHRKWRQTFEILYALSDAEVAALRIELGAANGDYERADRYIREAQRFLVAAGLSPEQSPAARQERLSQELLEVDRRLARARQRLARPEDDTRRKELQAVEATIARKRESLSGQHGELDALQRVASQLRTDMANLQRAESALALRELEFEICPRCQQDLPPSSPDTCHLCHQPDPAGQATSVAAEIERRRCERQLAETTSMISELGAAVEATGVELHRLDLDRRRLEREWNDASAEASAPALREIEQLGERRGTVLAALQEIRDANRLAGELAAAAAERQRLAIEQERLQSELANAEAARKQGRDTLEAFSDLYGSLLKTMNFPNMTSGGSIHPRQYVPLVDGEPVRAQSSGGLKTMANFAYFLAALQLRVRGYPTYLPPFMMIDSPRKNFGSNEDDAASMARCYRLLGTMTQLRSPIGFQVIVADNDSPSADRDRFSQIELSREQKLIDVALLRGQVS